MKVWDRFGALRIILVMLGFSHAYAPSAYAERITDIQRMLIEEAVTSQVPPALALAVARVESNFEPRALSPAGARGIMQIMPKTARGVFGVDEHELWNARLNIQLGVEYLRQLYEQYGQRWELALSHYNGGTLAGGSGADAVPHSYTRKYVADVLRWQRFYAGQVSVQTVANRSVAVRRPSAKTWLAEEKSPPYRPTQVARAERPARTPGRVDPLDFIEWAELEQRRFDDQRRPVDSSVSAPETDG